MKARGRKAKVKARKTARRSALRVRRRDGAVGKKSDATAAALKRELGQAHEQLQATAEVLNAIASTPGELGPVFDTILSNSVGLCEARFANLLLYEDKVFRTAAMHRLSLIHI